MNKSRFTSSQNSNVDQKLNRYVQRIQQIINRQKSRSPSPYNPRITKQKVVSKGPMIQRLDSYIKYEHSFYVLSKFMQLKCENFMKTFLNNLRTYLRPNTKQKIFRFIALRSTPKNKQTTNIVDKKSNILALRIINLFYNVKKHYFKIFQQNVKPFQSQQNQIKVQFRSQSPLFKLLNLISNKKRVSLFHSFNKIKAVGKSYAYYKIYQGLSNITKIEKNLKKECLKRIQYFSIVQNKTSKKLKQISYKIHDKFNNIAAFFKQFKLNYKKKIKNVIYGTRYIQSLIKKVKMSVFYKIKFNQRINQIPPPTIKTLNAQIFIILKRLNYNNFKYSFNKIKKNNQQFKNTIQNFVQILKNKIVIQYHKAYFPILANQKQIFLKSQRSSRNMLSAKKSDKKRNLISTCRIFGKLFQILNTKYSLINESFFNKIYMINERCKKLQNALKIIQKNQKSDIFFTIVSVVQSLPKETKIDISIMNSLEKTLNAKNKQIMLSGLYKIKNWVQLKKINSKINSKNINHLIKSLKKIVIKKMIGSYILIKNSKIKSKEMIVNPDVNETKLFSDMVLFLNQRNLNLDKIKQNYKKLKILLNYQKDNIETKQSNLQEPKQIILNLQNKLLKG